MGCNAQVERVVWGGQPTSTEAKKLIIDPYKTQFIILVRDAISNNNGA
jgi:hypothetical protein